MHKRPCALTEYTSWHADVSRLRLDLGSENRTETVGNVVTMEAKWEQQEFKCGNDQTECQKLLLPCRDKVDWCIVVIWSVREQ